MRFQLRICLMFFVCALLTACGGDDQPEVATVRIDHGLKPITIGVAAIDPSDAWPALLAANRQNPSSAGHPVRLKLKTGSSLYDCARSLATTDGAQALIVVGAPRRAEAFTTLGVPVYLTADLDLEGDANLHSPSASTAALAQLAADFTQRQFKPAKVAVLIDQANEPAVHSATRYAAELVRIGGRLGQVVYLNGQRSRLAGLAKKFKETGVEAVFIPYSSDLSQRLIEALRDQNCHLPIVLLNPPDEWAFGTRWRHPREEIYVISQFDSEHAGSGRAQTFLNARSNADTPLSSAAALAVDSYFMALDTLDSTAENGVIKGGDDFLAGKLAFGKAAAAERSVYAFMIKGRKLDLVEELKRG